MSLPLNGFLDPLAVLNTYFKIASEFVDPLDLSIPPPEASLPVAHFKMVSKFYILQKTIKVLEENQDQILEITGLRFNKILYTTKLFIKLCSEIDHS